MLPLQSSDLYVRLAAPSQLNPKPDVDALTFGKHFTDHMLKVFWHKSLGGWQKPEITPMENLVIHPAAKVLHYAVEVSLFWMHDLKEKNVEDHHVTCFSTYTRDNSKNSTITKIATIFNCNAKNQKQFFFLCKQFFALIEHPTTVFAPFSKRFCIALRFSRFFLLRFFQKHFLFHFLRPINELIINKYIYLLLEANNCSTICLLIVR